MASDRLVVAPVQMTVFARAGDGAMAQIEVITGPGRRRRWSEDQKRDDLRHGMGEDVKADLAPCAITTG